MRERPENVGRHRVPAGRMTALILRDDDPVPGLVFALCDELRELGDRGHERAECPERLGFRRVGVLDEQRALERRA
jgi:hypothetical protein